jgi:hypothetical protein
MTLASASLVVARIASFVMRAPVILSVALLAAVAAGCARNPPLSFDTDLRHVLPRKTSVRWQPTDGTERLGFAPLESSALPAGEREIRVQVECDECSPNYVFRFRTAGHKAIGEEYLLEGRFVPDAGDTAGARRFREDSVSNEQERAALRCGGWIRLGDGEIEGCRIGLPIDWHRALRLVDRSGLLRTVVDTGYEPEPPGFRVLKPGGRDPVTGVYRLPVVQEPPCRDLTGEYLFVEMLDGMRYGTATFGCLEVQGPPGAEHDRVRQLREALLKLVPTPDS